MSRFTVAAAMASALVAAGLLLPSGNLRWWLVGSAIAMVFGALLSFLPQPRRRNALLAGTITLVAFAPVRILTRTLQDRAVNASSEFELLMFCVLSSVVLLGSALALSSGSRDSSAPQ